MTIEQRAKGTPFEVLYQTPKKPVQVVTKPKTLKLKPLDSKQRANWKI